MLIFSEFPNEMLKADLVKLNRALLFLRIRQYKGMISFKTIKAVAAAPSFEDKKQFYKNFNRD